MQSYEKNIMEIDRRLCPEASYDIIKRFLPLGDGTPSMLYYIDGFIASEVMEKILEFLLKCKDPSTLSDTVPYVEIEQTKDTEEAVTKILSGITAFCVSGTDDIILIQARNYPSRGVEEPEREKVLRGPRDGFSETIIFNTALIRRRIRDPDLRFHYVECGRDTKTDVVVAFIDGKSDNKFVDKIINKLENINLPALSFGEQSIAEALVRSRWYNPFPKVRYTERPDAASAMLLEGSVVIICDNTPSVMILPTSIFDFLQESDDFYLPPLTATYLRAVRLIVSLVCLFLLPTWYMLIRNPSIIPPALDFIKITDEYYVPLFWQIILIELIIDGLKLASLNTPSMLSNSFSAVAGLILGDLAVKIGWFVPEVILYLAFVSIANFTQPSYELGYALKFLRMLTVTLTAVFNIYGFAVGIILVFLLIGTNKTVDGSRGYLYPLIPFNGGALKRFFIRVRLENKK